MPQSGVSHVALMVADLPDAEAYYTALFGLTVAFREVECEDGWRTLRPGSGWPEAIAAGYAPGLTVLHGGGLTLALEAGPTGPGGALSHIGLAVETAQLETLRGRLDALCASVVEQRTDLLVFADRFGVRWEVGVAPLPPAAEQSTGARRGRWLDLPAHPPQSPTD
jgi:catechol 2,3-dioxygenase-like lactoylglutathione lyase family enzyme